MSPKLKLTREKISNLIGLVETYARRHGEVLPSSEMGINLAEYVSSGDFQREDEIEESMPERKAFLGALESLSKVEMRELQGVMYLGRGDFEVDEFWRNTNDLPMQIDIAVNVDHVESKWPALGQYLRDGLSQAEEAGLFT